MKELKNGYYWVRFKYSDDLTKRGEWQVVKYDGSFFWICGWECGVKIEDALEIDPTPITRNGE